MPPYDRLPGLAGLKSPSQALQPLVPLSNRKAVPFAISVNATSLSYGQTVTGSKVSGDPVGTITWLWERVSGSTNVVANTPNSPSTFFYAGAYGNFSAVYRLKATLNGQTAYSANVTAIAYAEEPLPPLSVSGGGPGGIFASAADGYWSITTSFSVSGGSGDYSMVNSMGQTGTTYFFIEGWIAGPSGGWQDVTVALDVTDNQTGEHIIHSVQYAFVKP